MSQDETLYYGSPTLIDKEISSPTGTVFATPYRGMALCMAIKRARGVRFAEIDYFGARGAQVIIFDGSVQQKNVYLYQLPREGFEATRDKLIWAKQGSVKPIGRVERIVLQDYRHYFRQARGDEKPKAR